MQQDDFERILRETLQQDVTREKACLDGLEERIVGELDGRLPRLQFGDWLRQLLAPTRTARIGQLAVVGATAALFLILGAFIAGRTSLLPSAQPKEPSLEVASNQEVLFVVPALNAQNVSVVGDFNAWEATALSDDNQDGIWTASIPLAPGRYEYAFVIDERWWGQDPLADEYVRSFDQYSSVRYVGGGGDGV